MTETNWEFYVDRFEPHQYKGESGLSLPYRLLKPLKIESGQKYPLVLFMHGAGERGTDNVSQLRHGAFEFAKDERRAKYPCFLVAPQCPLDVKWVDVDWSKLHHKLKSEPTPQMLAVFEILDMALKKFPIDLKRIYVTGISMGGFATWDIITRYANRFAAALPICGGGDPAHADRLKKLPIRTYHGDVDSTVNVDCSRQMVKAIEKAGGHISYTEYPGVDHDSWTETYANSEIYEWLFSQVKI